MKNVVEFPDTSAIREESARWLIRLDGDDPLSAQEEEELRAWLNRSDAHREQLHKLAGLWGKMNVLTELAVPLGSVSRRSPVLRATWLAASTAVVAAIAVFALPYFANSDTATNGLYATAIGGQQSVALADGSAVFLNTDTQIRVDYDETTRDVHLLKGEAHFTVEPDAQRRFRVYAGTGRIEAVGTAFSVYLREDSVDVTVTEGRVALASVHVQKPEPNLPRSVNSQLTTLGELKAGQVASIESGINEPEREVAALSNLRDVTELDLSRRLAWTNGTLVFSGKPLEEVVDEISRYTTVKIEFSDPEVASIKVGGLFPVGETETMFDALETTFGLDVTYLSETHVLVSAGNRQ